MADIAALTGSPTIPIQWPSAEEGSISTKKRQRTAPMAKRLHSTRAPFFFQANSQDAERIPNTAAAVNPRPVRTSTIVASSAAGIPPRETALTMISAAKEKQ